MITLAILASGSGTNAEALMKHFASVEGVNVGLVLTNNAKAGVIQRAERFDVHCEVFTKSQMQSDWLVETLHARSIDFVVLAGFLLMIPPALIEAYPDKIINIHPALLPKFGGKGMYGQHVHEAVIAAKETQSGISIHLVNEHYDEGHILFQATCPVDSTDSADDVATKIHKLEHKHYPRVVEEWVKSVKG